MARQIATIGVYGTSSQSFFDALRRFGATHFVDIRRRRGLRGSQYSYANATALQEHLKKLGIAYTHELDLSPTPEIREVQKNADALGGEAKQSRTSLSPAFVDRFKRERLGPFDVRQFLERFPDDARIVFFCVERTPEACHRSIVADAVADEEGAGWSDITP